MDTRDNEMRSIHLNQVSWTIKRKLSLHGFNVHKIEEKPLIKPKNSTYGSI